MNNLTSQNPTQKKSTATDSRSSRIMSVKDTSPILVISILFVFVNILVDSIINIPLLLLLIIFIGITFHHWLRPGRFPEWITKYSDRIIRRAKIFPFELLIVIGVVYLGIIQLTQPFPDDKWYQFSSCFVVVMTFFLTELGNKAAYTGHRGWKVIWELSLRPLFSSKRRKPVKTVEEINETLKNTNETELEHITPEQLEGMASSDESDIEKSDLEKEQKQRWQEWIQEEMHRLGGKSSLD